MKKNHQFIAAIIASSLMLAVGCSEMEGTTLTGSAQSIETKSETSHLTGEAIVPSQLDAVVQADGSFLVEGDMIMNAEQLASLRESRQQTLAKSQVSWNFKDNSSWRVGTSATTIQYYLDLSLSPADTNTITRALRNISNNTLLTWQRVTTYSTNQNIVKMSKAQGLGSGSATIGKIANPYIIFDPSSSLSYRTAFHESMHILGFMHEHQRHDRVNLEIPTLAEVNAAIYAADPKATLWTQQVYDANYGALTAGVATVSATYDFASIMHYYNVKPLTLWTNHEWIGGIPFQSSIDLQGLQAKYGSSTNVSNRYYLRNSASNSYLCMNSNTSPASLVLQTTAWAGTGACAWEWTTPSASLFVVNATTRSLRTQGSELCRSGQCIHISSTGAVSIVKQSSALPLFPMLDPSTTESQVRLWNRNNKKCLSVQGNSVKSIGVDYFPTTSWTFSTEADYSQRATCSWTMVPTI